MTTTETLAAGRVRVLVRPWRSDAATAEVSSLPVGTAVPVELLARAVERAQDLGFDAAVTPALPRSEWRPYLDLGFEVREHLHLLGHDLADLPARPPVPTRRVGPRHRDDVLALDHAAFDPFWRLDRAALAEAVRATPSVRFRIARDGTGYALSGRAGDRGYIQRLGVDPAAQGRGLGGALVIDALHWMRRWRVREALVNTQSDNHRAIALYERLGFRRRRYGLAVLEADLR